MKTYKITVIAYCTTVVEADSEEQAFEKADQLVDYGTFEMDEMKIKTLSTPQEIESAKDHCNVLEV